MAIAIIAVMALIAYSMIRAAAQADAQEAKFWAEREDNERNDRTLVREEKRVKNENTASEGGGKHDIKERPAKHSRTA